MSIEPNPEPIVRDGLTALQIEFAIWLAQSQTLYAACDASGVPRRTAERWVTQEAFLLEYERISSTVQSLAVSHARAGVGDAVAYIRSVVGNDKEPTELRLKAAKMILDACLGAPEDAAKRLDKYGNPPIEYVRRPSDVARAQN